jgi:signal transduction histidine kinase
LAGWPLALDALGVSSVLCLPLRSGGRALGVSVLGAAPVNHFEPSQVALGEALVGYLAMATESRWLRRKLEVERDRGLALARGSIAAVEAERERVCLDLHDGVAQTLAALCQYQQLLEDSDEARGAKVRPLVLRIGSLVQRAIGETREALGSLRPPCLERDGLVARLEDELRDIQAQTGLGVRFVAPSVRLPGQVENALYRIVHEAINNARKHSRSQRLEVRLSLDDRSLVVEVEDFGVGFDPDHPGSPRSGRQLGLTSMRRRAELIGGQFAVISAPGRGTTVSVTVPLDAAMTSSIDARVAGQPRASVGVAGAAILAAGTDCPFEGGLSSAPARTIVPIVQGKAVVSCG